MTSTKYVLLTAAKNEADFIERPLESVIRQTVLPLRWIIVSDGSTDQTDDIVKRYASRHPFIELVRREGIRRRDFSSKVMAVRQGYERVKHLAWDYVGNLDADISLDSRYYERALGRIVHNSRIGLVMGTMYDLHGGTFRRMPGNTISGPVQLFRRECWEAIGGYLPVRQGGEDTIATIMTRMKGWEIEFLADSEVRHYRETGAAQGGQFRRRFVYGAQAHTIGYHPLFFLAMTMRDASQRAMLLGLVPSLLGYATAACKRQETVVPREFVRYLRREQMERLRLRLWGYCDSIGITGRSVSRHGKRPG